MASSAGNIQLAATEQESGPTRHKDKQSSQTKHERKLQNSLLSQQVKEAIAARSYCTNEKTDFDQQRLAFENDWKARKYLGQEHSDAIMGDSHEKVRDEIDKLTETARLRGKFLRASHESSFVRKSDETEAQAKRRFKAEQENLDYGFRVTDDYVPQVVDKDLLTRLRGLSRKVPRWLYRVSSWQGTTGSKSTNGHDEIHFHLPAAFKNFAKEGRFDPEGWNYVLAQTIDDEYNDLNQLVEKLGRRFLWQDRRNDPTLSWTSSLLFALILATARHAKKQNFVVIHVIDTTEVRREDNSDEKVEFFHAQDLLREFDIQGWTGWQEKERTRLRKPYYTHEWITHHAVKVPEGSEQFAYEAKLEDLVECGIYKLIAELHTRSLDDMVGLYHRCVYTRSVTHRRSRPIVRAVTHDELASAERLSACFEWTHRVTGKSEEPLSTSGSKPADATPHINIILDLLGLKARPDENIVLTEWASSGFGGRKFDPACFEGLIRVANNLPEQMQSVALAREICQAFQFGTIPPTEVWLADSRFDWHGKWLPLTSFDIKIKHAAPTRDKKRAKGESDGQSNDEDDASATSSATSQGQDSESDKTPPRKQQKSTSSSESAGTVVGSAADSPADCTAGAPGVAAGVSESIDAAIEMVLETA